MQRSNVNTKVSYCNRSKGTFSDKGPTLLQTKNLDTEGDSIEMRFLLLIWPFPGNYDT